MSVEAAEKTITFYRNMILLVFSPFLIGLGCLYEATYWNVFGVNLLQLVTPLEALRFAIYPLVIGCIGLVVGSLLVGAIGLGQSPTWPGEFRIYRAIILWGTFVISILGAYFIITEVETPQRWVVAAAPITSGTIVLVNITGAQDRMRQNLSLPPPITTLMLSSVGFAYCLARANGEFVYSGQASKWIKFSEGFACERYVGQIGDRIYSMTEGKPLVHIRPLSESKDLLLMLKKVPDTCGQ